MSRVSQPSSRDLRDAGAAEGEFADLAVLDVVRLERERPGDGLPTGATGTIVEIFDHPEVACEVEVLDAAGAFLAEVPVTPDELSLVERPMSRTAQ